MKMIIECEKCGNREIAAFHIEEDGERKLILNRFEIEEDIFGYPKDVMISCLNCNDYADILNRPTSKESEPFRKHLFRLWGDSGHGGN